MKNVSRENVKSKNEDEFFRTFGSWSNEKRIETLIDEIKKSRNFGKKGAPIWE